MVKRSENGVLGAACLQGHGLSVGSGGDGSLLPNAQSSLKPSRAVSGARGGQLWPHQDGHFDHAAARVLDDGHVEAHLGAVQRRALDANVVDEAAAVDVGDAVRLEQRGEPRVVRLAVVEEGRVRVDVGPGKERGEDGAEERGEQRREWRGGERR